MVASVALPVAGLVGCSGREEIRGGEPAPAVASPANDVRSDPRITSSTPRHRRPHLPREEPSIRVRVATRSGDSIELGAVGQRLWMTVPGSAVEGRLVTGPVRCRPSRGGWSIRSNRNGRTLAFTTPKTDRICFVARDSTDPRIAYRSIGLPGLVSLVAKSDESISVMCHLEMEDYLPGVLAGELYQSWLPETHEAVAIAARSFAVCERHYWLDRRDFDVVAGERSQMWVGATTSSRALEAVARTRGEVLAFDNAVVPGYYSAACGGRSARAVDAISPNPVNAIPPLGVDGTSLERCGCKTFGSHGSWQAVLPGAAVVKAIKTWGERRGNGTLSRIRWPLTIEVVERLRSGRPTQFVIRSRTLETPVSLAAPELQRLLNSTGSGRPVRSADFEVVPRRSELVVRGSGFGHGVGLCQYGAEAMARAGDSTREILQRYYPGATVERAWV